ncbi:MAG: hypothetical protein IH946_08465 [Bacteroidetes bacterium]|nr:hypothetical protein [Bacteroidota bacterium]
MKTIAALFFALSIQFCLAQENSHSANHQNDPHFPAKGKANAGMMTTFSVNTPPPILVADVTYGISDKTSIALIGGTTGVLALYGVKFNTILLQKEDFRIHFRMPVIYYPSRDGAFLFDKENKQIEPWILATAAVSAEWVTEKYTRWSVGMGVVETHCVDDMKGLFNRSNSQSTLVLGEEQKQEEEESMNGVFNTIQGSVSFPISEKLTFNAEVVAVMNGFQLSKRGEFRGGFPINPYLTLIYSF